MKELLVSFLLPAVASVSFASTPQFASRQDLATGITHINGFVIADFNSDGKPDFAITDSNSRRISIFLGKGDGTFSAISTELQTIARGANCILTGDFNEDDKPDLIVGTANGPQLGFFLAGNGDGTFTQQTTSFAGFNFLNGTVADFNGDSHLDFIAGSIGSFSRFLGDGHGGFQYANISGEAGLSLDTLSADLNSDHKMDLVSVSSDSPVQPFLGNGNGTFSLSGALTDVNLFHAEHLAVADLNGDGKQDLIVGSFVSLSVYYGNGDGTFDAANPNYPFKLPQTVGNTAPIGVPADIDGDGKTDLVIADDASQTLDVDINDGGGRFPEQAAPNFTAHIDVGTATLATADFNGDGLPDIILTNNITQNISIFLSIGPKTLPEVTVSPNSPSAVVGSSISVTVKVAGANGIVPTGPVTLMDDSTSLGQQTLDANGQAIFTLSNLAAGFHTFSAVYAGDINYYRQTSILVGQTMMDIQIASTTPSQTVTAGAIASYSVTITPAGINGFNQTITLTCSQLPALATCDPVAVQLFDKPVTATFTVKTAAPIRSQKSNSHYAFALLPLFAVCCIRRRRLLTPLLGITLICSLGFFATGCSSSKSSTSTPGTPSGSSTFTITASGSFLGQTLTRTTTATLVVQ